MITKRRILRKRDFSRSSALLYGFLGVLVLMIIGLLLSANFQINKKRSELSAQVSYLEKELRALEEKKAQHEQGLMRAETDEFWEEKLREQGYKRPGEEVFVVVPQEEVKQQEAETEKSFWRRLLEKLGF